MSETRFKKSSSSPRCSAALSARRRPQCRSWQILIFKLPCGFFVDLLWELAMTGEGWRIFAIALYVLVCLIPAGGAAPALEAAQALP